MTLKEKLKTGRTDKGFRVEVSLDGTNMGGLVSDQDGFGPK